MTKLRGKLLVFMDGECALCRVTSTVLAATDRAGTSEVVNYREDDRYRDHGISEAGAASSLHVIDTTTGTIYAGFDAVRRLAREVPLLWPLRPVFALLAALRIGDPIYDFVATRRQSRPTVSGTLNPKR